jgi:uncharacterized membrane protein
MQAKRNFYILISFVFIVALTACKSGNHFTCRKYTSGRYFERMAHKNTAEHKQSNKGRLHNEAITASKVNDINPDLKAREQEESEIFSSENTHEKSNHSKIEKMNVPSAVTIFHPSEQIVNAIERLKNKKSIEYSSNDDSIQIITIIAFVCGTLALITQIAAFILSIALLELSPVFIIGFVLAIAGIACGITGLVKSKDSTNNANRVFSVLGISLGGGALILGLVLMLYAFVLVSVLSEI